MSLEGSRITLGATSERVRILFISGQHLVADAVRVALESRGVEVVVPTWTGRASDSITRQRLAGWQVGAGLVVGDFLGPEQREAAALLGRLPLSWLLLVEEPADPAWSELVDSGATGVVPSSVALDDLVSRLADLVLGRARAAWPDRDLLEEEWRLRRVEQEDQRLRMGTLSPREHSVLALLHDGLSVREIAELTGVREGTVRSQVKAVLRKLGVSSQLAAVAQFQRWSEQPERP